jgi:hypothetical protein
MAASWAAALEREPRTSVEAVMPFAPVTRVYLDITYLDV